MDYSKLGFPQSPYIKDLHLRLTDVENDGGGYVPDDSVISITDLRAITECNHGDKILVIDNESVYVYDIEISATDNGGTIIKPNDIDASESGRWVQIKRFSLTSHTHIGYIPTLSSAYNGKLPAINSSGTLSSSGKAISDLQLISQKNSINGYPGLDASGKISASQIPQGTSAVIHTCTKPGLSQYILFNKEEHDVNVYDLVYVEIQDLYYRLMSGNGNLITDYRCIGRDLAAKRLQLIFTEFVDETFNLDNLTFFNNRLNIYSIGQFNCHSNNFSLNDGDTIDLWLKLYVAQLIGISISIYKSDAENGDSAIWTAYFTDFEFKNSYVADANYSDLYLVIEHYDSAECEIEFLQAEIIPVSGNGDTNNISDEDAAQLTSGGETTLHTHPSAGVTRQVIAITEASKVGVYYDIQTTLGVQHPSSVCLYNELDELVDTANYRYKAAGINVGELETYELNISGTWHLVLTAKETDASITNFTNSILTDGELTITHLLNNAYPATIALYNGDDYLVPTSDYKYKNTGVDTGTLTIYEQNIANTWKLILNN